MTQEPTVTLSYSGPRCFFERSYRYRSLNSALVAAAVFAFAAFAGFMEREAAMMPQAATLPLLAGRICLWLFAVGGIVGGGWILLHMLRNTVTASRLTEEGIEDRRRVHPWECVEAVGGKYTAGGILIGYWLRSQRPTITTILPRVLMMTPPLTREEFDALIDRLQDALARMHPHLVFHTEPKHD